MRTTDPFRDPLAVPVTPEQELISDTSNQTSGNIINQPPSSSTTTTATTPSSSPIPSHHRISSSLPHEIQYGHTISSHNPKHSALDIVFNRQNRIYRPHDTVRGWLLLAAKDGWTHGDINLQIRGEVKISVPHNANNNNNINNINNNNNNNNNNNSTSHTQKSSPPSKGSIIATGNQILLDQIVLIKPPGRIEAGLHRFDFSFLLVGTRGGPLLETVHGTYLNISYIVSVCIERGFFSRTLERKMEFLVQVPSTPPTTPPPPPPVHDMTYDDGNDHNGISSYDVPIHMSTQQTETLIHESTSFSGQEGFHHDESKSPPLLQSSPNNNKPKESPLILITGIFHNALNQNISQPIVGEICIEQCNSIVKSILVQIFRIEIVSLTKVRTHIQSIQLAQGLIFLSHNFNNKRPDRINNTEQKLISLPIYIVLPRLSICPTIQFPPSNLASSMKKITNYYAFEIQFEMDLVVEFDNSMHTTMTKTFPLILVR